MDERWKVEQYKKAKNLGLREDEFVDLIELQLALGKDEDLTLNEIIEEQITIKSIQAELSEYPFKDHGVLTLGDVHLAMVMNTTLSYGIDFSEISRHILVIAQTGSGKTVFTMQFVIRCVLSGKKVIVFDPKRDYQAICSIVPNAIILSKYNFGFNP